MIACFYWEQLIIHISICMELISVSYTHLLLITFILYIFITYGARELHKRELRRQMETGVKQTLFIVTSRDMVGDVIAKMKDHNYARYKMCIRDRCKESH